MSSMGLAIPLGEANHVVSTPALAAEALGLKRRIDPERTSFQRLEEWISSTIDADAVLPGHGGSIWNRLIKGLPGARRRGPAAGSATRNLPPVWAHFRVAYKRGITIVTLVDRNLVKPARVEELRADLLDLIEADNHRVVVDFRDVERFSSWVAAILVEAARRAAAKPGGMLKVCGIDPRDARVFAIAGPNRIVFAADEPAALDTPWPADPAPPALPVEILAALLSSADAQAMGEQAPTTRVPATRDSTHASRSRLTLLIQLGGNKPRPIPVNKDRYVVGRQQGCDLRINSPLISKRHAVFLARNGQYFVQDLASTNGTIVRGKPLRNAEIPVQHGDRVQIGPAVCTLRIEPVDPSKRGRSLAHDASLPELDCAPEDPGPTLAFPTSGPDRAFLEERFAFELVQDALVATPRMSNLLGDEEIDALREALRLSRHDAGCLRLVVNLENIDRVAPRAIGVLLAHHLRLHDQGGAMRICQARARVMTVLHQVRLTMLVECYPSLDQAVLDAWPRASAPAARE